MLDVLIHPRSNASVFQVVHVDKAEEDIDVEERPPHSPISSRISFTSSFVTRPPLWGSSSKP
jgi:hypothetical protein